MIRFTATEVSIEIDAPSDVVELLKTCLIKMTSSAPEPGDEKTSTANAERCKRYRDNKKRAAAEGDHVDPCHDHVTTMSNHVATEERENEKEEEKERTKEKEEERVKEKEELINIYAPEKSEKPKKHKYGNFQHVFLTDDDYQRLAADFSDLPERIQRLDDYLENNPSKHYANHNLTIRNWAKKDSSQTPKEIPKEKTFRDLRIEIEQQEQQQDLAKQEDYFVDSFWRA